MANKPDPFITVYQPIAGWKAVMYWWNDEDAPFPKGFWEPWQTSPFAYSSEAEAERWGRAWAEAEGIEFKPRVGSQR